MTCTAISRFHACHPELRATKAQRGNAAKDPLSLTAANQGWHQEFFVRAPPPASPQEDHAKAHQGRSIPRAPLVETPFYAPSISALMSVSIISTTAVTSRNKPSLR